MMIQSQRESFLEHILPLLYFNKCFGMIYLPILKTHNKLLTYICNLCYILLIFLLIRWCILASQNILHIRFLNHNNVNTVSGLVHHACVCWESIFRYLVYFWNRKRFKTILTTINDIGTSLNIDRSKLPTLRYQFQIFIVYVLSTIAVNIILVKSSTIITFSIETILFYCLQFQFVHCETFLVKIYLDEIKALFRDINVKLTFYRDVDSLVHLSNMRLNLSRILLENDDVINASLMGTLLSFFVLTTNSIAAVLSNIKAHMENNKVDPILILWNTSSSIHVLIYIWFLLKIRIHVLNEVSGLNFIFWPNDDCY